MKQDSAFRWEAVFGNLPYTRRVSTCLFERVRECKIKEATLRKTKSWVICQTGVSHQHLQTGTAEDCLPWISQDAAVSDPDGVHPALVGAGDQREDGLPLSRPREDRPSHVLSDRGVPIRPRPQVLWGGFQQDNET